MIRLRDILKEVISEMGFENDWGTENVVNAFNSGDEQKKKEISIEFTGKPGRSLEDIQKAISELNKDEFDDKLKALGLYNLEEACWKGYKKDPNNPMKKKGDRMVPNCVRVVSEERKQKIKRAYLTKNASAMEKEIKRVKKLESDDPAAYGKWKADYSDEKKTKPYQTKKSAATSAYEKRFGKKESVNEGNPNEKEMIDGIVEMLKQVKDLNNRKNMAIDRLKDFKKEGIKVDENQFLQRCGIKIN